MATPQTMDILTGIFQMVFDDDTIEIGPEMTADDIEPWDSLSHVTLITAIEAEYKIRFTPKELLTMKNIGDLRDAIDAKTVIETQRSA